MKSLKSIIFFVLAAFTPFFAFAAEQFVSFSSQDRALALFTQSGKSLSILCDSSDHKGVKIALGNLCRDFGSVGGVTARIVSSPSGETKIIAGSIDKSSFIKRLIKEGKLDSSLLQGRREKFIITTLHNPLDIKGDVLLIAGSDKRGTIYGIYELSQQMGVSPWYWWADAPVRHHEAVYIKQGTYTDGEPKVRYRGLFINDEEPSFGGWAKKKFGGYNSKMYCHLFELILRLRGNYLWPAMWNSAFNEDDPKNPLLADEYGIIMGTSHHEPMMRAHKEYTRRRDKVGPWDYAVNKTRIDSFFTEGIERNKHFENLITIGMRGDGDRAMGANDSVNMQTLRNVIQGERGIIAKAYGRPASDVPQMWAIFTEVQRYYDAGFTVPDDVMLVFCDNNWGYIRRTGPEKEKKRKGGMGLYYHIDMNGGPWNDRWINTTTIPKLREQFNLAYRTGIDDLWIVNVGDLKPKEYPIDFIFKYAWNPDAIPAGKELDYTRDWARSIFGDAHADDIAELLSRYSKYNLIRKPEVETTDIFSYVNHHEAEHVYRQWQELVDKAEALKKEIPQDAQDAYYELVYYPVIASAGVAQIYINAGLNNLYAKQGRVSANDYAQRARELFERDKRLTDYYNKTLAGGKWECMMSDRHIGYTKWSMPDENTLPPMTEVTPTGNPVMGVAVEGKEEAFPQPSPKGNGAKRAKDAAMVLPTFDYYTALAAANSKTSNLKPQTSKYIDVFNRGKGSFNFKAKTDKKWIKLSQNEGKVEKNCRVSVTVDWAKLPDGISDGTITLAQDTVEIPVRVKAVKAAKLVTDKPFYGTLTGEYSIPANGFTANIPGKTATWKILPDLGRAEACMGINPVTAQSAQAKDAPVLEYNVYLSREGSTKFCLGILPTQDVNPERGLRLAVALDDGEPMVIDARKGMADIFREYTEKNLALSKSLKPLPSSKTNVKMIGRRQPRRSDVLDGLRWLDFRLNYDKPGLHTLKVYMVDPEIVLEKIVVNPDNAHPSYMGAPVVRL